MDMPLYTEYLFDPFCWIIPTANFRVNSDGKKMFLRREIAQDL